MQSVTKRGGQDRRSSGGYEAMIGRLGQENTGITAGWWGPSRWEGRGPDPPCPSSLRLSEFVRYELGQGGSGPRPAQMAPGASSRQRAAAAIA